MKIYLFYLSIIHGYSNTKYIICNMFIICRYKNNHFDNDYFWLDIFKIIYYVGTFLNLMSFTYIIFMYQLFVRFLFRYKMVLIISMEYIYIYMKLLIINRWLARLIKYIIHYLYICSRVKIRPNTKRKSHTGARTGPPEFLGISRCAHIRVGPLALSV